MARPVVWTSFYVSKVVLGVGVGLRRARKGGFGQGKGQEVVT